MATSTEQPSIAYVSDDYFPPDESNSEGLRWSATLGFYTSVTTTTAAATSTTTSRAASFSTLQWWNTLTRRGSVKESNTTTHTFLSPFSLWEAATALEEYIFSDAAARDVRRVAWIPVPNAALRHRLRQVRQCMLGQTPAAARLGERAGPASAASTSSQCETVGEVSRTLGAALATPNASTLSVSMGERGAVAETSTCLHDDTATDEASPQQSFASRTVPARGFTNSTFALECWGVLASLSQPPHCETHSTLFVLAAAWTFASHRLSTGSVTAPTTRGSGNVTPFRTNGNQSQALVPTIIAPLRATTTMGALLLHVPLALLQGCGSLVRAVCSDVFTLLYPLLPRTFSSFLPAKDSLMGALATNAQWRWQVEVMLLLTVALLVVLWLAMTLRYRKYTRVVELWQSVEARHHAEEVRTWVAEMESRAFRPSPPAAGSSGKR